MINKEPNENIVSNYQDDEEKNLERLVFGDLEGFKQNLKKSNNVYQSESIEDLFRDQELSNSDQKEVKEKNNKVYSKNFYFDEEGDFETKGEKPLKKKKRENDNNFDDLNSVWKDSDDEKYLFSLNSEKKLKKLKKKDSEDFVTGQTYIKRLQSQFLKINPRPIWADEINKEPESDSSGHDTNEKDFKNFNQVFLNNNYFKKKKKNGILNPSTISIVRMKNVFSEKFNFAIQSLSFHKTCPLLLIGGYDKTLRVFFISKKNDKLVTSIHLQNFLISKCMFSLTENNKNLIYCGSKRRFMYKWDLTSNVVEKISRLYGHEDTQKSFEYFKVSKNGKYLALKGKNGWCNILNAVTCQWIEGFKVEGLIADFEFASDESLIIISNESGEIHEFQLPYNNNESNKKKLLNKWKIKDAFGITIISLGGINDQWLAAGSKNGLVYIYDRLNLIDGFPLFVKVIDNLITKISSLCFSSDAQILCIASRSKRDALKLIHLPTFSVFTNWPTSETPLGKVTSVCFSSTNEILAIGNISGKVTTWKINYF